MTKLIFSESDIYHLRQLERQVHKISGDRYKLSEEPSLLKLIETSSSSNDDVILSCYHTFANDLDDTIKSELISRGVVPVTH